MDLGLLYRALASGQVDMVAGNSTDGPIRALGFVVLEDDRHYFPPYEAVPLVREDSLRRHPGIQVAMERLAGKVSAEEMRGMNYAVDRSIGMLGRWCGSFAGGRASERTYDLRYKTASKVPGMGCPLESRQLD